MIAKSQPKFSLGQIVATPGALEALEKAGQTATEFLHWRSRDDWGDLCEEDRQANEQALLEGSRILSTYCMSLGDKLWVITEAADDDSGNRAATCQNPDTIHTRTPRVRIGPAVGSSEHSRIGSTAASACGPIVAPRQQAVPWLSTSCTSTTSHTRRRKRRF